MTDQQRFFDEAARVLSQDQPALAEIRRLMVEMDEFFNTPEFQALKPPKNLQGFTQFNPQPGETPRVPTPAKLTGWRIERSRGAGGKRRRPDAERKP